MVEPSCGRTDLFVDVSIDARFAIFTYRATGNDVHVSPGRWRTLRRVILRKLGFVLVFARRTVPQPRRVNSNGCNLKFLPATGWVFALTPNGAFHFIVQFLSDSAHTIFHTSS